jgi:hypothetical protein
MENMKENRMRSSDSGSGIYGIDIDPHKQKIEDKKLYLLRMLDV